MTNKRVYLTYGIISRKTYEIKNDWIIRTSMVQDTVGRLLNFGDIVLTTPEKYYGQIPVRGIRDPQKALQTVTSIIKVDSMDKLQLY